MTDHLKPADGGGHEAQSTQAPRVLPNPVRGGRSACTQEENRKARRWRVSNRGAGPESWARPVGYSPPRCRTEREQGSRNGAFRGGPRPGLWAALLLRGPHLRHTDPCTSSLSGGRCAGRPLGRGASQAAPGPTPLYLRSRRWIYGPERAAAVTLISKTGFWPRFSVTMETAIASSSPGR